jgi:cell division protein FtsB
VTGRALVLGVLVVVLLVLLASPLQRYFNSRGDVGHAAQQLHDDQKQLADLQAQQRLWSDPGYVQKQARLRLMYAMPGDTVYVVVNPGQKSDIEKTVATPKGPPAATWNEKLWRTVQAAGR